MSASSHLLPECPLDVLQISSVEERIQTDVQVDEERNDAVRDWIDFRVIEGHVEKPDLTWSQTHEVRDTYDDQRLDHISLSFVKLIFGILPFLVIYWN